MVIILKLNQVFIIISYKPIIPSFYSKKIMNYKSENLVKDIYEKFVRRTINNI